MEERPSQRTTSHDTPSYEEYRRRSASGASTESRKSSSDSRPQTFQRTTSFVPEAETTTDEFSLEDIGLWRDRRSTSQSPERTTRPAQESRRTSKGKERPMSSGSHSQSRTAGASQSGRDSAASPGNNRRADISRSNVSGNTSASRQASEGTRSQEKEKSDQTPGSGSGRSRLVSGVFVRY